MRRCAVLVIVSRSRVAGTAFGMLALAVALGHQPLLAAATVGPAQMSSLTPAEKPRGAAGPEGGLRFMNHGASRIGRIAASGAAAERGDATSSIASSSSKACSSETVDAGGSVGRLRLRFKLIGRVSCARAHRLVRTYFHKMATGGCGQLNNFCVLSFPGGWSCSIFSAGESVQAGGAMAGCARTDAKIRLFKARRRRSPRTDASFRSPSRNIACEMTDDPRGPSPHVYCQSFVKPHSVVMDASGGLQICRGRAAARRCIGDPGEHTPMLRYGKRIQIGRFTCRSSRTGISCLVTKTGMGFLIDREHVERLRP